MPENRNLSYAQLTEAHAWLTSQKDEGHVRLEDEGADLTEVMIRLGNGAYRAPLPRIIDRGPLTPEEAMMADEEDETDEEDDIVDASDDEVQDEYAVLADRMYSPYEEAEAEETARRHARTQQISFEQQVRHAVRAVPKPVFLADMPICDTDADEIHDEVADELSRSEEHDSEDHGPTAISSRRAVLRIDGVYCIEHGGSPASWKDTTKAETQFLRHVRRPAAYRAA